MKTIAAVAQKGGVGKSSFIWNLANMLRASGKRVLVIDLDSQGNQSTHNPPQNGDLTILEVLNGRASINDAITDDTIRSDIRMAEWGLKKVGVEVLQQRLQELKPDFDLCLIDTPPSLGAASLNAIRAAETIITPVAPGYHSLQSLNPLAETIEAVNPEVSWTIVCNGFNMRRGLDKTIYQFIKEGVYGDYLLDTIIPHSVTVGEAVATGEPLKRGKAYEAYSALLSELNL